MRLVLLVLATACRSETPNTRVRVAAAADLTAAFQELATLFTASTGTAVELTFGSTGLLAKQLSLGAPFDVFAAADVASVDELVKVGVCSASTRRLFARGRLVMTAAPGIMAPHSIAELADPRFTHLALANIEHAPYGRAAKASLESVGIWGSVQGRVVYADNVSHALQLVRTGNADVGLVARSLVKPSAEDLLVDEALHPPLIQAAVACGRAGDTATGFLDALSAHRALLTKYGFEVPAP